MELSDNLIYALLAVGIMLLVGFPVHEFFHAFAAHRLGDSTARWQGIPATWDRSRSIPAGRCWPAAVRIGSYAYGMSPASASMQPCMATPAMPMR